MNKIILYVAIGLVVVILAILLTSSRGGDAVSSMSPSISPTATTNVPKTILISYTDAGYTPANVTIRKGDTIKFTNNNTKEMWPASAMHPTHNLYPEPGGCVGSTFDACARIKTGDSWSFVFNHVGSWGYHDHISPNFFGKITVTE